MAFRGGPIRAPVPARIRVAVFAVGQRVYMGGAGDRPERVTLMDRADKAALTSLADGAEVTILGWLPGWAGTTRYCVRVTDSGLEGWLPVGDLRGTETSLPPAAPPLPVVDPALRAGALEAVGRQFGPRF